MPHLLPRHGVLLHSAPRHSSPSHSTSSAISITQQYQTGNPYMAGISRRVGVVATLSRKECSGDLLPEVVHSFCKKCSLSKGSQSNMIGSRGEEGGGVKVLPYGLSCPQHHQTVSHWSCYYVHHTGIESVVHICCH